jgi:hypothetical protein
MLAVQAVRRELLVRKKIPFRTELDGQTAQKHYPGKNGARMFRYTTAASH